jgi:hypothetical protein
VTGYGQTLKGAFYSNSGSTRDNFIIKKTQDPVPESTEKDLFSLTVNPATRSIQAGNTPTSTIQVAPLNGFNSLVTLGNRCCTHLIINLGPSDSWDDTTVQAPSAIQVRNQIWVYYYYSGNDGSAFRVGRAVANLS